MQHGDTHRHVAGASTMDVKAIAKGCLADARALQATSPCDAESRAREVPWHWQFTLPEGFITCHMSV